MADQSIESHDSTPASLTIDREPLKGQKALVTGIANQGSIACGAARALKAFGTNLAMTYLNDRRTSAPNRWWMCWRSTPDLFLPRALVPPVTRLTKPFLRDRHGY